MPASRLLSSHRICRGPAWLSGALLSLLIGALLPGGTGMQAAAAAERLVIQLEDLELPLRLDQLQTWSQAGEPQPLERRRDPSGALSPAPTPAAGGSGLLPAGGPGSANASLTAATTSPAADPAALTNPARPGRPWLRLGAPRIDQPDPDHPNLDQPSADQPNADQEVWLNLLEPASRRHLKRLLRAPLLRDRSFGSQLLDSWAGGQMLAEVGLLLTTPEGRSTALLLQTTLREMLRQQQEVTLLSLLRALPVPTLYLRLDPLLTLAQRWRRQIEQQSRALAALQDLDLPRRQARGLLVQVPLRPPRRLELPVPHRPEPLLLDLWPGQGEQARQRPWLLVLPGLGGNADQLGWFAGALAQAGWSVAVAQHPGSDGAALKAALDGRIPPPGAESLAIRLQDVAAALAAQRQGRLRLPGQGVVLVGHSLGGLTALLAAGLTPEPGLAERCGRAIDRLPLGNPSRLLQCELVTTGQPLPLPRPQDLRGVMLFNSFGSLLWPRGAAGALPMPLLMVGGSLDLVTPPLEEQLQLFLPAGHPHSRLVLVEGGSHFSPVRLQQQEAVLRLGRELVGVDPAVVQTLLLGLGRDYLLGLEQPPLPLPAQVRTQQEVRAYVLDPATARQWRRRLPL